MSHFQLLVRSSQLDHNNMTPWRHDSTKKHSLTYKQFCSIFIVLHVHTIHAANDIKVPHNPGPRYVCMLVGMTSHPSLKKYKVVHSC